MFGFSFNKLLFTVLLIVAVWRGFRFFEKLRIQRQASQAAAPKQRAKAEARPRAKGEVDLAACPKCGTFGPRGSDCVNCPQAYHGGRAT